MYKQIRLSCKGKKENQHPAGLEVAATETKFDKMIKLCKASFYSFLFEQLQALELYNKGEAETDKSCGLCCGPGQNGTSADKPIYFIQTIIYMEQDLQN